MTDFWREHEGQRGTLELVVFLIHHKMSLCSRGFGCYLTYCFVSTQQGRMHSEEGCMGSLSGQFNIVSTS